MTTILNNDSLVTVKEKKKYLVHFFIITGILFTLFMYISFNSQKVIASSNDNLNSFSLSGNVGIGASGNTGIGTTNPAYQVQVIADTPLAYWRLGESSGSAQASDSTGHGYNGTYNGGLTKGVSGALANNTDTAVISDGTGKITIPQLSTVTNFTIEGWSYLTDANWNSGLNYNNTLYGSYGKVRLLIRPGSSSSYNNLGYFGVWLNGAEYALQMPANGISNVNQWVHWSLVRTANTLTVYRNGQQVAQRTDLPSNLTADITGGLFASNNIYYLKGKVDEVAVYTYALTQTQIQTHYNLAH